MEAPIFLVNRDATAFGCEIEEYVKKGVRHPCLRPEEPDSAAQKYVTEDLKGFCEATSSVQKV